MMRIEPNDKQGIAWVFSGPYAMASFAYEHWGGREGAIGAAERFTKRDGPLEVLRPFADAARHHAADAPEWRDEDTVKIIVTIGVLRAALAFVEESGS